MALDPPTNESSEERAWRRAEFDRGYGAGFEDAGYSPTSLPYIDGYESGQLAAVRSGKKPLRPRSEED